MPVVNIVIKPPRFRAGLPSPYSPLDDLSDFLESGGMNTIVGDVLDVPAQTVMARWTQDDNFCSFNASDLDVVVQTGDSSAMSASLRRRWESAIQSRLADVLRSWTSWPEHWGCSVDVTVSHVFTSGSSVQLNAAGTETVISW